MTETLTIPSRDKSDSIGPSILKSDFYETQHVGIDMQEKPAKKATFFLFDTRKAKAYGFRERAQYRDDLKGNSIAPILMAYSIHRPAKTTPSEETEKRFKRLAQQWKEETWHCSSIYKITMHSAYQRIMAMGPVAIPLILRDLSRETNFWFWALTNMAGEDPVPKEARGKTKLMAKAWLEWGKNKGYEF